MTKNTVKKEKSPSLKLPSSNSSNSLQFNTGEIQEAIKWLKSKVGETKEMSFRIEDGVITFFYSKLDVGVQGCYSVTALEGNFTLDEDKSISPFMLSTLLLKGGVSTLTFEEDRIIAKNGNTEGEIVTLTSNERFPDFEKSIKSDKTILDNILQLPFTPIIKASSSDLNSEIRGFEYFSTDDDGGFLILSADTRHLAVICSPHFATPKDFIFEDLQSELRISLKNASTLLNNLTLDSEFLVIPKKGLQIFNPKSKLVIQNFAEETTDDYSNSSNKAISHERVLKLLRDTSIATCKVKVNDLKDIVNRQALILELGGSLEFNISGDFLSITALSSQGKLKDVLESTNYFKKKDSFSVLLNPITLQSILALTDPTVEVELQVIESSNNKILFGVFQKNKTYNLFSTISPAIPMIAI
jgi:hypothetical protein